MGRSTTGGPKGLGQITDTASTVADLNWIIGLIAATGNVRNGTPAERDALSGDKLYEGALFVNTTEGSIEQYSVEYGWQMLMRARGSYTPTVSGLTLGVGGQVTGRYAVAAGVCHFWITAQLGTGAAATGTIQLGLPFEADFGYKDVGTFLATNPSGARAMGVAGLQTVSQVWLLGTGNVFMSDAAPWAWGGGCEIRVHGSYVVW
jgi:hypothetical protein